MFKNKIKATLGRIASEMGMQLDIPGGMAIVKGDLRTIGNIGRGLADRAVSDSITTKNLIAKGLNRAKQDINTTRNAVGTANQYLRTTAIPAAQMKGSRDLRNYRKTSRGLNDAVETTRDWVENKAKQGSRQVNQLNSWVKDTAVPRASQDIGTLRTVASNPGKSFNSVVDSGLDRLDNLSFPGKKSVDNLVDRYNQKKYFNSTPESKLDRIKQRINNASTKAKSKKRKTDAYSQVKDMFDDIDLKR